MNSDSLAVAFPIAGSTAGVAGMTRLIRRAPNRMLFIYLIWNAGMLPARGLSRDCLTLPRDLLLFSPRARHLIPGMPGLLPHLPLDFRCLHLESQYPFHKLFAVRGVSCIKFPSPRSQLRK